MRFPYDTSYRDPQRLLRYRADWLAYGALLAVLIVAPAVLPTYYVGEVTYVFIMCVASLGLMVLTGFTGQISFGHAAFVAIGAYVHVILLTNNVPFVFSILAAGMAAGVVGLLIGLPAIRVSGLHLAMVTLAFSIIVEQIVGRWKDVTGGFTGLPVPRPIVFGFDFGRPQRFYFLCLAVLAIVLLALINVLRGHAGRAFVAVRDSEAAAYSLGVWVAGYKVLAFTISAGVTGLAGALLAHHVQFVTPEAFSLLLSLELIMMVVIGGLSSLRGALFGAIFISLLPTFISKLKPVLPDRIATQFGLEIFVFGLVLALFILFEPMGLNGRWIKLKRLFSAFPLYRRDTFRRGKTYMRSERYR
jgi:branched-chain amino acid transport system permease protein